MRKFLVMGFFVAALVAGMVWMFYSPRMAVYILPRILEHAAKGVKVLNFSVNSQACHLRGVCVWRDIVFSGIVAGHSLDIQIERLEWSGWRIWGKPEGWEIVMDGVAVHSPPGEAQLPRIKLAVSRQDGGLIGEGVLAARFVIWDKLKLTDVSARLSGNGQGFVLRDIKAGAYGGGVTGSAAFDYVGAKYRAALNLEQLDTRQMADFDEELARQISGNVSGTLQTAGSAGRVNELVLDLRMSSGSAVNAGLLGNLTSYLPQSKEAQHLQQLVKAGGKLAVEIFSVTIKSVSAEQLAGELHLASKEINANINLAYDIHTDETWDSLAEYWKTLLK